MKRFFTLASIVGILAANVTAAPAQTSGGTTPYGGYEDGTFILNEGWFGHDGGSINFLAADGGMTYNVQERENAGFSFGNTSCSGMVYGGRLYVMSKQAGETGGALVVMDAKTLKVIASFNEIGGGDGRSIAGANPHKVYIGTTAGVVTFDVDNMEIGDVVQGIGEEGAYRVNVGEMPKAGGYGLGIEKGVGVRAIDAETDRVGGTIACTDVQGIAQTADGSVWIASSGELTCVDPATLETEEMLTLPEGVNVMCQWGAWKPTAFCASRTANVLYWNQGGSWIGGNEFYRYEIGSDISTLKPFFTIEGLPAADDAKTQQAYGVARYDDRTGQLVVLTTQSGYGANYEHNWIHLVNGATGELEKTVTLDEYYWFPTLPIFPDKYAPEFVGVENKVGLEENGQPYTVDLAGKVADRDNIAYNITLSLAGGGDPSVADARLEGTTLTIAPVAEGTTTVTLAAESNGVVTELPIAVSVGASTGIGGVEAGNGGATEVARFTVDGKKLDRPQPGVNIVRMSDGTVRKVVVGR